jgi:hypothetical protein
MVVARTLVDDTPLVDARREPFDPRVFARMIGELPEGVWFTALVPAQLVRLVDFAEGDTAARDALRRLDRILVGGQATPARLIERASGLGQRLILDPLATDSLVQTVRSLMASDHAPEPATGLACLGHWILAVGPESGFDPDEIEAAKRAGFRPVRMGPRVLRTETAGPAAIAVLQTLCGDF